jgi:branched-chain amino acid transport system permease protein
MLTISIVNGIAYGCLLFLLAAGFSMIFGVLKIVNLAHGSFFLFGAHVALSIYEAGGGLALALAGGGAIGAVFGLFCERFILNRLQGDYLGQVLVTMGILFILGDVALIIWGGTPRMLHPPGFLGDSVPLGAGTFPVYRLALIVIGIAVAVGLWWMVEKTTFGARARAAVDDEDTAQAIGISVPRLRLAVFGLGGFLAGLSGALGSGFLGARPGTDIEVFLLALVIVVIGGVGSLGGAFLAAILVGITDSISKVLWPEASYFVLFAPMAAFLIFRPTGLFGRPITVLPPQRSTRDRMLRVGMIARLGRRATELCALLPTPVWVLLGLAAIVACPFVATRYETSVVTLGFIWAIFAIGLNVALGYVGMPSLGHAAFFGTGAYAVAIAGKFLQVDGWTALGIAVLASAIMAAIVGLMVLRTKEVQLLLATVASSQVVWGIAFKWRSVTGGDDGMGSVQKIAVPGAPQLGLTTKIYVISAIVFVLVCFIAIILDRSRFRRVLNGVRDNENRMLALGYQTWMYRFGAFVISGTISGIGGALFTFYAGFVSPDLLSIAASGQVLLMVIIGGAGTLAGPIVGAFAIIALKETLSGWTERWQAVEGLLFIIVALVSRHGIVGAVRTWRQPAYKPS